MRRGGFETRLSDGDLREGHRPSPTILYVLLALTGKCDINIVPSSNPGSPLIALVDGLLKKAAARCHLQILRSMIVNNTIA